MRRLLPKAVRDLLRDRAVVRIGRRLLVPKRRAELRYWRELYDERGGFQNGFYEAQLLGMAGEQDQRFIAGKIIADFGCGPQGSLVWARAASLRIGIDLLATDYLEQFAEELLSHDMVYVASTEKVIPLPSCSVDVMFTSNALDHVADFQTMCDEIVRVIKPGGLLVASLNLEEPATSDEPQTLTEEMISATLLAELDVETYRATDLVDEENVYAPLLEGREQRTSGRGYLWVRARKPDALASVVS